MESNISKSLMYLNEERIKYKQKAEYNILKSNLYYIKSIIRYIFLGDFSYAIYRLKEKITRKYDNKYNCINKRQYNGEKIAIYTVAFGNYDKIKDPLYKTDNCDYYLLTNSDDNISSEIWNKYEFTEEQKKCVEGFSNLELARFFKLHPDILFPEYKYSIFVDGNVQIVTDMIPIIEGLGNNFISLHKQPSRECLYQEATEILAQKKCNKKDVKKQIEKYKREGFPKKFGMYQTNILAREHNNKKCKELMETWWNQIKEYTKRDQLSFTYALWKLNYNKENISIMGESSYLNPRFIIDEHIKKG